MPEDKTMSFWDHLDELRVVLIRSFVVLMLLMVGAFFMKEQIFNVVFAPLSSDFILFRLFDSLLQLFNASALSQFNIQIVNIDISAQFFTHLRVSFYIALIVAMPFLCYQIWLFVRPALYDNEKKAIRRAFSFAAILFYIGVIVGYFLVLPLTVRFLGTYQVSVDVPNQIALNSYIGMFMSLVMIMGVVFEMPVLAFVLSKIGVINKGMMRDYRKYAIVILLVLAAIITPSGDAVTLAFVAIPLYLLYEFSIVVCR